MTDHKRSDSSKCLGALYSLGKGELIARVSEGQRSIAMGGLSWNVEVSSEAGLRLFRSTTTDTASTTPPLVAGVARELPLHSSPLVWCPSVDRCVDRSVVERVLSLNVTVDSRPACDTKGEFVRQIGIGWGAREESVVWPPIVL